MQSGFTPRQKSFSLFNQPAAVGPPQQLFPQPQAPEQPPMNLIQKLTGGNPMGAQALLGLGAGLLQGAQPGGSLAQGLAAGGTNFAQALTAGQQQQLAEQERMKREEQQRFQNELAMNQDQRAQAQMQAEQEQLMMKQAAAEQQQLRLMQQAEALGLDPSLASPKLIEEAFKAQQESRKPQSALGKLAADFKAGRISQAEYQRQVAKEQYIAPTADRRTQLAKLIAERDSLAPDDPQRAIYEQAILKQSQPAGTYLEVGPDGSVSFGQGAQKQTAVERNKLKNAEFAGEGIKSALGDYKNMIKQFGAEGTIIPSVESARMNAVNKTLQLQIKDLFELGALTGPDVAYLEALIPDATALKSRIPGFQERALAQIGEFEKFLNQRVNSAREIYGGQGQGQQQGLGGTARQDSTAAPSQPAAPDISGISDDDVLDWD